MCKNILPCLVGCSHIWLYGYGAGGPDKEDLPGRDLAGEEALALQGLPWQWQRRACADRVSPSDLMDLAGNAFCGAVCSAVLLTALCHCPWAEVACLNDHHSCAQSADGAASSQGDTHSLPESAGVPHEDALLSE